MTTISDCTHHWLIGPQGGPTSSGTCKHCGAVREFVNSGEACELRDDELLRVSPGQSHPRWPHRLRRGDQGPLLQQRP